MSLTEKYGRVELSQYVSIDDEVEFVLAPGTRGARFTATQVSKLKHFVSLSYAERGSCLSGLAAQSSL